MKTTADIQNMTKRFESPSLSPIELLIAGVFGVLWGQQPLFSSNQNTYFAHGIAENTPRLGTDWFISTRTPFPVFNWLVEITGEQHWLFQLYFALLGTLFCMSILSLLRRHVVPHSSTAAVGAFGGVLILMGSNWASRILFDFIGVSPSFWLMNGLAGQYVLGSVLQPSMFGVLLLVSIERFTAGRTYAAVIWLCVATWFHPTYLLAGAVLCLSYMHLTYARQGHFRPPAKLGDLALILTLPIVVFSATFLSESDEVRRAAQQILFEYRLPHHADPLHWFSYRSCVRLGLIIAGYWCVRKTALGKIMAWLLIALVLGSLLQVTTGSRSIALLFPWRLSVLLVPISTSILAYRVLVFACDGRNVQPKPSPPRKSGHVGLIATVWVVGVIGFPFKLPNTIRPHEDAIAAQAKVMCQNNRANVIVPADWARFRLLSGCPILADRKNHPYKHKDVISWWTRLETVKDIYRSTPESCALVKRAMVEFQATHIVLTQNDSLKECEYIPNNTTHVVNPVLIKLKRYKTSM